MIREYLRAFAGVKISPGRRLCKFSYGKHPLSIKIFGNVEEVEIAVFNAEGIEKGGLEIRAFSMMGYGSVDLWMAALSNGQISGTREELDNSAFTAEDIASLFGASSDIISTAAYGGVEYYTARITSFM